MVVRDVTIHLGIAAAIAIIAYTIFIFRSAPHQIQKHCMTARKCCITIYASIRKRSVRLFIFFVVCDMIGVVHSGCLFLC